MIPKWIKLIYFFVLKQNVDLNTLYVAANDHVTTWRPAYAKPLPTVQEHINKLKENNNATMD